jgi:hypothetical protein
MANELGLLALYVDALPCCDAKETDAAQPVTCVK